MRAINLCNALASAGHNVVLWSAAFNHQDKRHRKVDVGRVVFGRLENRLISSPGYRKNVGIGRLVDHAVLALNLKRALKEAGRLPDVAFIGYPPVETAAVMTRWLAREGVPSLLDVKDQWPELFLSAVPAVARSLGRLALLPYRHLAQRAMREADGLCAMADGFLEWALLLAGRRATPVDGVFPLTSPLDDIPAEQMLSARQWWDNQGVREDGTIRFMFAGSHSRAFDFEPVREAARRSLEQSTSCEFVLCGTGDRSTKLRRKMEGLSNVRFPGWVDRPRLVALAERCQAALAPYRDTPDFQMSLPNKVLDALSLGLPVVSPLSGEVAALIAQHGVGLSYGEHSGRTLSDCVEALARDPVLQSELARSARCTYEQRFSFEKVYGGLVIHLERLAESRTPLGPGAGS